MKEDSSFRLTSFGNAVKNPVVVISVDHNTPSVTVCIEVEMRWLIFDTGSRVSILQPGISRSQINLTDLKPFGVTGEDLDVKGRQYVSSEIGGRRFHHALLVCELPTEVAGLIGTDFLLKFGAEVDFQGNKVTLADVTAAPGTSNETPKECMALTVFMKGKEGHSTRPSPRKARRKDEHFPAGPPQERDPKQSRTWLVRAKETSPWFLDAKK